MSEEQAKQKEINLTYVPSPMTFSDEVLKKAQEFGSYIQHLEKLVAHSVTNEAGIVRMKLAEAFYWANISFSLHESNQAPLPAQPVVLSVSPVAPVVPQEESLDPA